MAGLNRSFLGPADGIRTQELAIADELAHETHRRIPGTDKYEPVDPNRDFDDDRRGYPVPGFGLGSPR